MSLKPVLLSPEIRSYILSHTSGLDPVLADIAAINASLPEEDARMQISQEQVGVMQILARLVRPRRAIEVGTFTGMSSIAIASGLAEDGTLICCDLSKEWTDIARDHWLKAGVADKVDLRLGDALQTIRSLPSEPQFDFAFLDADKPNYPNYYEELVSRLVPGGLLLVDNVLWYGAVVDESNVDIETVGIRQMNDLAARDERVDAVITAIGDGLSFIQRR